jgi:hypothetical protein
MRCTSHSVRRTSVISQLQVTLHQGRRPLSALGVAHVFQRRTLVRQWQDDFPAIHTEGGQPGSDSAGIVAFIRERLVDLGEDPRSSEGKEDLEAQDTPSPGQGGQAHQVSSTVLDRPQMDGVTVIIPLLNVDPAAFEPVIFETERIQSENLVGVEDRRDEPR